MSFVFVSFKLFRIFSTPPTSLENNYSMLKIKTYSQVELDSGGYCRVDCLDSLPYVGATAVLTTYATVSKVESLRARDRNAFLPVDVKYLTFFQGFWTGNGYPTERAIQFFPGPNFEDTQVFSSKYIILTPQSLKTTSPKIGHGP